MRSDLAVTDPAGAKLLAVEVKALHGRDSEWAAKIRSNLRTGDRDKPRFFMLVTPDQTYLWNETAEDEPHRLPDASVPTLEILSDTLREGVAGADGRALEFVVSAWLSSVVNASTLDELPQGARQFLQHTGLYEILRGGAVRFQAA
jgi:hypothetical protein